MSGLTSSRAPGSRAAQLLSAVGLAAMAHLRGDSEGVLSALVDVGDDTAVEWLPMIQWHRSVAHRRNGDLQRAYEELDAPSDLLAGRPAPELEVARLRVDWLRGDIDHVCARLLAVKAHYQDTGQRYLLTEMTLELTAKLAWLGELQSARELLADLEPILADMPGALARILRLITLAAIAVGDGDEAGGAALLRHDADAAPGRPESWYWRDRAALALVHVLVPEARTAWADEPLGSAHLPGLLLAHTLEATRNGDLSPVQSLRWPKAGVVRAHLPVSWAVELAAAGHRPGTPRPTSCSTRSALDCIPSCGR